MSLSVMFSQFSGSWKKQNYRLFYWLNRPKGTFRCMQTTSNHGVNIIQQKEFEDFEKREVHTKIKINVLIANPHMSSTASLARVFHQMNQRVFQRLKSGKTQICHKN